MDDQVFQMLKEMRDDIRGDLHGLKESFATHVEEDRKVWQEVWFVKRLLQGTWAAIIAWFGWKGTH